MTTIAEIIEMTAWAYGIEPSDVVGRRRTRRTAYPRQLAMHIASELLPKSLPDIGKRFGRDHTTVLHAIKAVDDRLWSPQLRRERYEIVSALFLTRNRDDLPHTRQGRSQALANERLAATAVQSLAEFMRAPIARKPEPRPTPKPATPIFVPVRRIRTARGWEKAPHRPFMRSSIAQAPMGV